MPDAVVMQRTELLARLFPAGVPPLWCPLLTHYDSRGGVDRVRMQAHLRHVSQWVRGYLIPGSTGDGWELTPEETREVMDFAVTAARERDLHLLIGILLPTTQAVVARIVETVRWLERALRAPSPDAALAAAQVRGFAVCPPIGADLSAAEIEGGLAAVLDLGLPTALYQLPQVTHNEMSPEVVARLAARYPNFVLLKDSSGADRIALSELRPQGVHLVRGAEGEYAQWLTRGGGPYDGLLLSTANCFAAELADLVARAEAGDLAGAEVVSRRLTEGVQAVFGLVADLPSGNAFANANKAMDHFFAYGPTAEQFDPPLLHNGLRLPAEVILATKDVLARYGLLPERGYLAESCRLV